MSKDKQYTAYFGVKYPVDTPKLFSMKKAALFGMFSLLSILLVNVPAILENTYAYGEDTFDTNFETSEGHSSVRVHFVIGSPVHPSLVLDDDSNSFVPLEERTNPKKHFSYGIVAIAPSHEVSSLDHFDEKRR